MRNLKYFTFERNKYFYGKLLSVDDLVAEQRYMNDKRRLINRLVHGTGVVCGMNVVQIDDITISVEMGVALDFAGREIVLESPVTKKLSMIDGFEDYTEKDEENSYLYLCVEYDETEKEPVHSIAGSRLREDQKMEYNKYAEGYHLYLTNQEPEQENVSCSRLYEETNTIYWKNGIRIRQTVPRYVQGGQDFDLRISVENMGQTKPVSFRYDLKLTCIQGDEVISIAFDETDYAKAKYYEFSKTLRASAVSGVEALLSVVEESFHLEVDRIPVKGEAKGISRLQVISENIKKEIVRRYYERPMEDILKDTYQQDIYLAKISVIHAGGTYIIDGIENMPLQQYLFNNTIAAAMNRMSWEEGRHALETGDGLSGAGRFSAEESGQRLKIANGTVILDLGLGGNVGQKFFSEEIPHGLGLGFVNIVLGKAYGMEENSHIVFGAQDIFEEPSKAVKVEMAAQVNVEKGTFRIGIKCLEQSNVRELRIHWTAIKDGQALLKEKTKVTMQIKPDMQELSIRDTHYFEAMIGDNVDGRIKWSVRDQDGGSIDENGMYSAPNKAGVYEIIAESKDYPDLKASTFVVVRNV